MKPFFVILRIDRFGRAMDIQQIKESDYNLSATLYVLPEEEVEEIDLGKEWEELGVLKGS